MTRAVHQWIAPAIAEILARLRVLKVLQLQLQIRAIFIAEILARLRVLKVIARAISIERLQYCRDIGPIEGTESYLWPVHVRSVSQIAEILARLRALKEQAQRRGDPPRVELQRERPERGY